MSGGNRLDLEQQVRHLLREVAELKKQVEDLKAKQRNQHAVLRRIVPSLPAKPR